MAIKAWMLSPEWLDARLGGIIDPQRPSRLEAEEGLT